MKRPIPGSAIWSVLVSLPIAAAISGGCVPSLDSGPEPAPAPTVSAPPAPRPAPTATTPVPPAIAPPPMPAPPAIAPTPPSPTGPTGGGFPPPGGIDPTGPECTSTERVLARIVKPKCALCHDESNPALFAAGLDLTSPRLRAQLKRNPSRQCAGPVQGIGRPMVFTEPYVGGHFFDVVNGTVPPGCGERMPPIGPPLSRVEIRCLQTWLAGRD